MTVLVKIPVPARLRSKAARELLALARAAGMPAEAVRTYDSGFQVSEELRDLLWASDPIDGDDESGPDLATPPTPPDATVELQQQMLAEAAVPAAPPDSTPALEPAAAVEPEPVLEAEVEPEPAPLAELTLEQIEAGLTDGSLTAADLQAAIVAGDTRKGLHTLLGQAG